MMFVGRNGPDGDIEKGTQMNFDHFDLAAPAADSSDPLEADPSLASVDRLQPTTGPRCIVPLRNDDLRAAEERTATPADGIPPPSGAGSIPVPVTGQMTGAVFSRALADHTEHFLAMVLRCPADITCPRCLRQYTEKTYEALKIVAYSGKILKGLGIDVRIDYRSCHCGRVIEHRRAGR